MRTIDTIRRDKKAVMLELQRLEAKLARLEAEEEAEIKKILEDVS